MIIYIILVISLAAKCSSIPPSYPNFTKPVLTSYLQKFRGKLLHPAFTLKSHPMSTENPCSETTVAELADEADSFGNEEVQYAPLPFKLKDKKSMTLNTKVSTPKTSVAIKNEGDEEAENPPQKWYKLEPDLETYRGPKVYNQFLPGQSINSYPYLKIVNGADEKLAGENDKLEGIYRSYVNYENEWKSKEVPKLAMFNEVSLYTTDDEELEMDITTETTSEASTQPTTTRTKPRFTHMNVIRDFKSNRISHVAPAAGLLRMVAHPVGNFKLRQKELSKLRNKDIAHI